MKTAVYPGTFDPVTNGHLDIIERALKIFDKLFVVVADNPNKKSLFSKEERVSMIKEALNHNGNVEVDFYDGLLLNYVKDKGSKIIIRGLRAISDFEFEVQRAQFNRELEKDIDTFFIMTKDDYAFLSSSIVKEIAMFDGKVDGFVPKVVAKRLKDKFKK